MLRRRHALIAGAGALAWPLWARAQAAPPSAAEVAAREKRAPPLRGSDRLVVPAEAGQLFPEDVQALARRL